MKKCIQCGEDAYANCYSDAGRREVAISGLCEKCFDKLFDETNFADEAAEKKFQEF